MSKKTVEKAINELNRMAKNQEKAIEILVLLINRLQKPELVNKQVVIGHLNLAVGWLRELKLREEIEAIKRDEKTEFLMGQFKTGEILSLADLYFLVERGFLYKIGTIFGPTSKGYDFLSKL